jgi:hypothetical protein
MATKYERVTIGVFENPGDARSAIAELRAAGFSDKKVGLLTHDKDGDPDIKSFKDMEGNRAGTGAAIGAAAGAGGGALWALGIAAGLLPAIGPVVAGGILGSILASAATGAAAGTVVGALTGLGISDEDAAYYDEEFRKGNTIVAVKGDDRADEAYDIMQRHRSYGRQVRPGDVTASTRPRPMA